jgi:hypothetical protein
MISAQTLCVCREGKPLHTFLDAPTPHESPAGWRGFFCALYRPLGLVGPTVDPLGDEFIRLLPDGFRMLLAPALELPALRFGDAVPDGAWPVVVPLDIDPLGGAAPAPVVPLAPPLAPPAPPLCANATGLVSASAAASNVIAFIFIPVSSAVVGDKLSRRHMFPR